MNIRGYRPRLYGIWLTMRARCNTATNNSFPHYGARGISVCPEWDSYELFHAWAMRNGYSSELTLDRIDNDGDYEPGNCRWATMSEQARNTRRNIVISYGGEELPLIVWVERTGLPYAMLRSRFKMGWSHAEILGKEPRRERERLHPGRKLTEAQARTIKLSPTSGVELAHEYGVSKALICRIRNGSLWKRLASVDEIQARKA